MSFLNKDVKSKSPQAIAGLFAEVDKELGWDQLFIHFAKAAKGKYENDYYSPLFALEGEVMEEYGEQLSEQLLQQINQCLLYALKQRLTEEERDALLDVLVGDITAGANYLIGVHKDEKNDMSKKIVAQMKAIEPTTWDNVFKNFFIINGDPSVDDRVIEILTRYNKSLGMQVNGILEDCVKRNFLNKLPADVSARLKVLMVDTIQRTSDMKSYTPRQPLFSSELSPSLFGVGF